MEQYERNILKAALTAAVESMAEVLKQEPVDFEKFWEITQKASRYYMELTGTSDGAVKAPEPIKSGANKVVSIDPNDPLANVGRQ